MASALSIGILGCGDGKPEIKKYEDMTGDGIKDILIYEDAVAAKTRGNYLFIGKEDDSFIRTREKKDGKVKYFLSDDGLPYFFDGEFYKSSPKPRQF